jgi:hypothetical protein
MALRLLTGTFGFGPGNNYCLLDYEAMTVGTVQPADFTGELDHGALHFEQPILGQR